MAKVLLHLSDVHLFSKEHAKPPFWARLLDALQKSASSVARGDLAGLVITGDLIDSPDVERNTLIRGVTTALRDLRRAVGDGVPLVVLPGNHDRREGGVLAPWREDAMEAISHVGGDDVIVVAPRKGRAHATKVTRLEETTLCAVAAYDSTHVYRGKMSAGGHLRTDDLLALRGMSNPDHPTLVLMHHHIIPTPITDLTAIPFHKAGFFKRLAGQEGLRRLVGFGDREEVFMTALGAGSFLSSLHALGSAVLVLHGHKHYPVVRVSSGTHPADGDVILASAGSAGVSEGFEAAGATTDLWPSFNIVTLDRDRVSMDVLSFSAKKDDLRSRRPILSARREGARWRIQPIEESVSPRVAVDRDSAVFNISATAAERWTFTCERLASSSAEKRSWREAVFVPKGAVLSSDDEDTDQAGIEIVPNVVTRYSIQRGICATLSSLQDMYGEDESPFEWLGLTVRHATSRAILTVRGLPEPARAQVFGTRTDLRTGERRPVHCTIEGDEISLSIPDCPPLQFLQVLWPVEGVS